MKKLRKNGTLLSYDIIKALFGKLLYRFLQKGSEKAFIRFTVCVSAAGDCRP